MNLLSLSWVPVFSFSSLFGYSQDQPIYTFVEEMPRFPGGRDALQKLLRAASNYPMPEYRDGSPIGGPFKKVVLNFIVRSSGTITDVKVAHSDSKELNAEAMRVAESLPPFIPGRQQGKAVPVYYNLIMLYE